MDKQPERPQQGSASVPMLDAAVCVFCGEEATTRDHVPPQSIFLEPRPSNLITVPSCASCNNGRARLDERFRNFIALRVTMGGLSPLPPRPSVEANKLKDKTMRAFQRRPAELVKLLRSAHQVNIKTEAGLYLGTAMALPGDGQTHDTLVRRIVQGLYAHHYRQALPSAVPVNIAILNINKSGARGALDTVVPSLTCRRIGGVAFEYAFARAKERPEVSTWLLNFYQRHMVWVHTGNMPGGGWNERDRSVCKGD